MSKSNASKGGRGKPAPIPPNNGLNPAGWPTNNGTNNLSGGGRNNGPQKGKGD